MRPTLITAAILLGLSLGFSGASVAAEPGQPKEPAADDATSGSETKMTPELKKDMADMYQKMADCLRTDKSLERCSKDAMKNCPVIAKTGHCPINEGMRHSKGRGMRPPMGPPMGPKGKMGGMDMGEMKETQPKTSGE